MVDKKQCKHCYYSSTFQELPVSIKDRVIPYAPTELDLVCMISCNWTYSTLRACSDFVLKDEGEIVNKEW